MVVPNCGEHMPGFSEKAKAAAPARGIGRGTGAVPSISGARISSGAGGYRFACSPAGNTAAGQISGCHNPISLLQLSYEEIAKALELPLRTVETRLYRGRNKLKEQMIREMGGDDLAVQQVQNLNP